ILRYRWKIGCQLTLNVKGLLETVFCRAALPLLLVKFAKTMMAARQFSSVLRFTRVGIGQVDQEFDRLAKVFHGSRPLISFQKLFGKCVKRHRQLIGIFRLARKLGCQLLGGNKGQAIGFLRCSMISYESLDVARTAMGPGQLQAYGGLRAVLVGKLLIKAECLL